MKQLYFGVSLCILLLTGFAAFAQSGYVISGTVTDEKGHPLKSATVFLSQSQSITTSDEDGHFRFNNMDQGLYRLIVTMVGYLARTKDISLKSQSVNIKIELKLKIVELKQVNIGGKDHRNEDISLFKKEFLGSTDNAAGCEILNPEILNFSTRNDNLYADADDFLIIENKRLGYRIKYLLKTFRHKIKTINTAYNGDAVFEELPGTEAQKQEWAKNRLETYRGSMMHFFRAVFTNTTLQEGFVVYQLHGDDIDYSSDLVRFSSPASPESFVFYKFKGLYISYNPKKAARLLKKSDNPVYVAASAKLKSLVKIPAYESKLFLFPKEAVIDARGSVATGYFTTFLIIGDWIKKRVGDQLPFEYQPPPNTLP